MITPAYDRRKSSDEPGVPRARGNYVSYYWPEHPIAVNKGIKSVQETHILYWQRSGYDPDVLEELCKQETEVHHVSGDYESIDANLELSTAGKHAGTSENDKVKHLTRLGYRIQPPPWKGN